MRVAAAAALMMLASGLASAVDLNTRRQFDIPAQTLSSALIEFGRQTNIQVMTASTDLEGLRAAAVRGEMTLKNALERLLAGTNLRFEEAGANSVTIGRFGTEPARTSSRARDVVRVAQSPERAAGEGGAQEKGAPGAQGESGDRGPDEIIVTAQKRAERLQDVPVPVTAVAAESLVDYNQLRLQDYYTKIPGLAVTPALYGAPRLTIRGLTTGGFTNPTVGITVDDVPYGASTHIAVGGAVPDIDPSELQRVEVLRGPQGTLYGASSIGGLVKFVTLDPSTEALSGRVHLSTSSVKNGDGLGYNIRGSVNVPLGERTALRASAFSRRDPGYIDDPSLGTEGVNEVDVKGGRLSLLWRASDTVSLKVGALFQHSTADGSGEVEALPTVDSLRQNAVRGSGWFDKKVQVYDATLTADLGAATLTSVSGYSINRFNNSEDFTAQFGGLSESVFGERGTELVTSLKTTKFTQEIRFSVPLSAKADWLVGAFYNDEDSPSAQQIPVRNTATGAFVANWADIVFPSSFVEYALFTNLTYHFTDRFDVQIGGRQSRNEQNYHEAYSGPLVGGQVDGPHIDARNSSFTYLLTPRFKISDDLMAYVRFASGFRPGGPNSAIFGPPPLRQFAPDKSQTYEMGIKGYTPGRMLNFDASVYYIDWKDFQLLVGNPAGSPYYANGSRAKSQGLELTVESRPTSGLSLTATVALTDAELTEDLPATAFNAFGLSGDRLPYSSRFSGNLSAEQEFDVSARMTGFVGASLSYVGDRASTFMGVGLPRQTFPSYTQADVHAGIRFDSWTVNVFLNNATDQRGILGGGSGGDNPNAFFLIQPRTAGVAVSKTF